MNDNLETLDDSGKPPKSRIKDAKSALAIWHEIRRADGPSSFDRARIDSGYDNEKPFSDAKIQPFRVNVSWGWLDMVLGMAMAGYVDIYSAVESLFECPTDYGLTSEKKELEDVVALETSNAIRSWPGFFVNFLRLASTFIKHGVSVALPNDESDWRFEGTGLSDFKIPRKTKIDQENIETACCLRFYSPTKLYKMIEDPKTAEELGYNVKAIIKAIQNSINNNPKFSQHHESDWEKLQVELRNNDAFFSHGAANAESIRVVNMWFQEFDGRVSHYLVLDDENSEEFLYKGIGRYDNVYQAFILFTYGVGTNEYYHGIRGQGYKAFSEHGALNIAACQMLEMATYGSAMTLQPKDESAMQEMQFMPVGPFNLITPGVNVLKDSVVPNVSQNALPVLQAFGQMFKDRTAQYNTEQLLNASAEKTKYQLQSEQGAIAKMSVSDLNLFYTSMELLLKEMVRRMKRKSYGADEPGGKYVVGLRKRLLKRGQESGGDPERYLKAFYELDTDRLGIKKAIGSGSEAARMLAFDRLKGMIYGSLPDWGKQALDWDITAEIVGHRNANRYAQKPGSEETPAMDTAMAQLENNILFMGGQVNRIDGQNDFTHAKSHLEFEMPMLQEAEDAISGDDMETVGKLLPGINALNQHAIQHVEKLSLDPMMKVESAQMRQAMQQADEVLHNGMLKLQKHQADAQKEQIHQQEQQQPQIDQATLIKIESERAERQARLEMDAESHKQKLLIQREEAAQKLLLRDADMMNKIQQSGVRATSK